MTHHHRAFIGLGSNLERPQRQIHAAFAALAATAGIRLVRQSSLYCTAPLGVVDQPDFVNAVAEVRTRLSPHNLLDALLAIELRHGRVRTQPNAPRTLDLDILIYDDLIVADERLDLPHPRAHLRAFVLCPLLEIAPECVIPGLGPARSWLDRTAGQSVERIADDGGCNRERDSTAAAACP